MALKPVHININPEIYEWKDAEYGEDVRDANVSALTKLQDQANAAIDFIVEKGDTIDNTVTEVQRVKGEAQAAVDHANDITAEYKQYADNKLAQTEAQRQLAETAKQGADDAATLAESWAKGGTGTRPGEDGNSSRYYSLQSKTEADRAAIAAARAEQYADFVIPDFNIDFITGDLTYTDSKDIEFHTNMITGNLEYGYM